MTVRGNGVLQSLGTADFPVFFFGSVARAGHWEGISMSDTNFTTNVLQHTVISHTGNTENLSPSFAALRMDEAYITLVNSTFSDNAQWGIYCTEADFNDELSVIVDGGGNTFFNNAGGDLPSFCSIQ